MKDFIIKTTSSGFSYEGSARPELPVFFVEDEECEDIQGCDFYSRRMKAERAKKRKFTFRKINRRARMLESVFGWTDEDWEYNPKGKLKDRDPVDKFLSGEFTGKEMRYYVYGYGWRHQKQDLYDGIKAGKPIQDIDCE